MKQWLTVKYPCDPTVDHERVFVDLMLCDGTNV